MEDVKIKIGNKIWSGWTQCSLTKSIEQACSTFGLSVTIFSPLEPFPIELKPWSPCKIYFGDDLVLTGFVEQLEVEHTANQLQISLAGRSRTLLALKNSTTLATKTLKGLTLAAIVNEIAKECGINVILRTDFEIPAKDIKGLTGDSAWRFLERICRNANILLYDDIHGNLVLEIISEPKTPVDTIEFGKAPILAWSYRADTTERYTEYVVTSRTYTTDDNFNQHSVLHKESVKDDKWSTESQILIIRPEGPMTKDETRLRAAWEAAVRAGSSFSLVVKTNIWRDSNNMLWQPGQFYRVIYPMVYLDKILVLSRVDFILESTKQEATLEFKSPFAYIPKPAKGNKSSWWAEEWR